MHEPDIGHGQGSETLTRGNSKANLDYLAVSSYCMSSNITC